MCHTVYSEKMFFFSIFGSREYVCYCKFFFCSSNIYKKTDRHLLLTNNVQFLKLDVLCLSAIMSFLSNIHHKKTYNDCHVFAADDVPIFYKKGKVRKLASINKVSQKDVTEKTKHTIYEYGCM